MAHKAVVDAVMARLGATYAADTGWTGSWSGLTIVEMNKQGETDAAGGDFLVVQFPVSTTTRQTVSQGYYREEGGFRLVLNMQRGVGVSDVLTKADALAALFRDQKFGIVEALVPSAPFLDDSNDQGGYFQASIVVPYRAFYAS